MYPVAVAKVTATLGGARTLGTAPSTVDERAEAVAHGLPRAVVPELAAAAAPKGGTLRQRIAALVVAAATYKRAARLARVTALAVQALGSVTEAQSWLNEPHPLLGGRAPIAAAVTDLGARQVERLLHNIERGLPA